MAKTTSTPSKKSSSLLPWLSVALEFQTSTSVGNLRLLDALLQRPLCNSFRKVAADTIYRLLTSAAPLVSKPSKSSNSSKPTVSPARKSLARQSKS